MGFITGLIVGLLVGWNFLKQPEFIRDAVAKATSTVKGWFNRN